MYQNPDGTPSSPTYTTPLITKESFQAEQQPASPTVSTGTDQAERRPLSLVPVRRPPEPEPPSPSVPENRFRTFYQRIILLRWPWKRAYATSKDDVAETRHMAGSPELAPHPTIQPTSGKYSDTHSNACTHFRQWFRKRHVIRVERVQRDTVDLE